MKQILKRLELIKTSIDLDDEEIIELQITKLLHMDLNSEVKCILLKLKNLDYGSAAIDIENYIKKYTGVVEYVDTEMQGLRLELKALEKKLQHLSEEKNEYLNDIDEFNTLYSIKLGDIIQKILKLQEGLLQNAIDQKQKQYDETEKVYRNTKDTVDEIKKHIEIVEEILDEIDEDYEDYDELHSTYQELKEDHQRLEDELNSREEELKQAKEELEDNPLFEEHEEAKANYEEYSSEYEDIKHTQDDVYSISNKENQKLKKLFRKASRLCHPDLVTDELKKQAHELTLQLNEAYGKKDLEKVRKILSRLEKGTGFMLASDSIDDKKILKVKISNFRENISDLEADIEDIKQDDTFETIQNIEDMDEYFEKMYSELEEKYNELEQKASTTSYDMRDKVNAIIDDQLSEDCEDLDYFSTTATAKEHNIKAKPHLFDRLIELSLLYQDKDNKYKLTTSGKKIGGKYKENEKGNIWVVWKEHSLDKIIEDLKESLEFVSVDAPAVKEKLSKISISDLPIGEYEECMIIIKEVGKTYIVIELNSDIYKIGKPKNTTWTAQDIYTGMACIVEKTFYGNRNQYCKLNLIKTVKNPQIKNENNVVYTQAPLKGNQKEIFKKITKQIENIIETDMVWDNMLALVGAAGTGKTFLLTEVIKIFQNDYDITVTAPTHKALSVINKNFYNENLGNIATKTIHSFLNIKLFNDYENGTQKFMPDKSVVDKSTAELLIVDEASMISDDIFKYIEDAINDGRVKCVLLVGDPYQLLPIDDSKPILSKINHSYELTQIVRQAEDSYIIQFATKIRDIIETQDYQDLNSFVKNNLLEGMEILTTYTDMYDDFCENTSWEDENKVIGSYTNKNVDSINKIIRNRYWSQHNISDPENIRKGDKLILSDGSQIVVKEVNRLWIKDSGIYYWECEDDEFAYNIIDVDSINTYENKLTSMADIAKSEKNYKKRRKLWDEFFDFKDRFIEAKYSFSSTIHKLQGSTCETIYIDVDSFNVSRDMDTIYRLFYVAVTRASHNVKLKIQS